MSRPAQAERKGAIKSTPKSHVKAPTEQNSLLPNARPWDCMAQDETQSNNTY